MEALLDQSTKLSSSASVRPRSPPPGTTREFKLEAIKLVTERGISKSQAARDLGIHLNVLRKWIADYQRDAHQPFPGRGKQRAEDAELSRLRREPADVKAERDILRKAIAYFAKPCTTTHSRVRVNFDGM